MSDQHEYPHRVALAEAVRLAGSQQKLADAIGRSQRNVWDWLHVTKGIPAADVLRIERATGVSRHLLAPGIFDDVPGIALAIAGPRTDEAA